jgi:hypothetical protein
MTQTGNPEKFAVKQVDSKNLPQLKMTAIPFPHKAVTICRFTCGGKKCRHEDWRVNPNSAIRGLNSDWITPNILATQRPSSRLIKEYGIIDQFHKHGIGSIYNLEEPGEHPFCADGILVQSGFSYLPEEFYNHGIYFFNFGWEDMTTTSVDAILKVLRQMALSFKDGKKVAVHCHAGRGRTGMIIAAWLIFAENYSAKDAIALFRSKRAKSLSKKPQQDALYSLEKALKDAKYMFFKTPKYSVSDYLQIQRKMPLMELTEKTKSMPMLMHLILKRFSLCFKNQLVSGKMIITSIYDVKDTTLYKNEWSTVEENSITTLKAKINEGHIQLSEVSDHRVLTQLLLDFIDGFTRPLFNRNILLEIQAFVEKQEKFRDFIESERISSFDASDFYIIERLVRFFAKLRQSETITDEELQKALTRLSISLLVLRKQYDGMFMQRNLIPTTLKDPIVEAVVKFLTLWVNDYQKDDVQLFSSKRGPIRINYQKLNALVGSKTQEPEIKANRGVRLPKIEHPKKEEETQSSSPTRPKSIDSVSKPKNPTPQKRRPSPFRFARLPGGNPDITESLNKRQELLDQKIENEEARTHVNDLIENFMDLNNSVQELVIEQLNEIHKASNK